MTPITRQPVSNTYQKKTLEQSSSPRKDTYLTRHCATPHARRRRKDTYLTRHCTAYPARRRPPPRCQHSKIRARRKSPRGLPLHVCTCCYLRLPCPAWALRRGSALGTLGPSIRPVLRGEGCALMPLFMECGVCLWMHQESIVYGPLSLQMDTIV